MKKSTKFPITRRAFFEWLDEKPRARAGSLLRCPLETAAAEITGKDVDTLKLRSWPKWVTKTIRTIDESGGLEPWTRTRGSIRKLLS